MSVWLISNVKPSLMKSQSNWLCSWYYLMLMFKVDQNILVFWTDVANLKLFDYKTALKTILRYFPTSFLYMARNIIVMSAVMYFVITRWRAGMYFMASVLLKGSNSSTDISSTDTFVYYCIPGYRTVIHPTSVSANHYFHQFQLLLTLWFPLSIPFPLTLW